MTWRAMAVVLLLVGGMWSDVLGEFQGLPDEVLREVRDRKALPRGRYTFVKSWEAEGEGYGHKTGRKIADKEASGGAVWEVREWRDVPGHALYGPYVQLPAGDYVAFFRVKLMGAPVGEVVAEVDACVEYGRRVLNFRQVADVDLVPGKFVQIPLAFRYPGGKLECRLWWPGMGSLRVDKVALFKVEGARLEEVIKRAPRPVPSGEPSGLAYRAEPRPFPDLFPRSKPPSPRLVVADVRKLPRDWKLALVTLQGIVNRERPTLYMLFFSTDEFWLEWLRKRGWVKEIEAVSDPRILLKRFGKFVKGMVIYD
ncbi:MAG TPA: hypothetical protein EYP65_07620, partial [Armatimonadetes bacterium]|nr:hypothetical protein [Armatimonadota bacterium]